MFLNQLRAILRAAAHGQVNMLIPMLAHASEIRHRGAGGLCAGRTGQQGVAYRPDQAGRHD